MSAQAGPSSTNGTKGLQTFEFTKRKRWADLLVGELADVIVIVLSPSRQILYCGNAVTELLGWRVLDVLDRDLLDLVPSPEDQSAFCSAFQQSISTNVELLSYLRFKSKFLPSDNLPSYKDVLFELKGYPHFVHDECKCFFAMARPYPSRNASMLDTFVELKMENERLQQRLAELHSLFPLQARAVNSLASGMYTTSTRLLPVSGIFTRFQDSPASYYAAAPSTSTNEESLRRSCDNLDGAYYGLNSLYSSSSSSHVEEDSEEYLKKKKLKKSHPTEQYVCITCGRTDSPEWRKGPLGPKTLCNACGLRWAKQMRKYDEPAEGTNSSEMPVSSSSS